MARQWPDNLKRMKDKLLLAGVIGPLLFIVTFLIEGATRSGYNPWLMYVSQLGTGPGGWVQIANFLIFGTLVVGYAIGLRLVTRSIAAPILIALFGAALLVAGIFPTDPGLGYPVGAPEVHTLHGTIHGFAGLSVFTLLPAACFVLAWHFGRDKEWRWAAYSIAVGVALIVLFFGGFAVGQYPGAPTGLYQRIAIITGWTWIALVAWHLIRGERRGGAVPA